MSETVVLDVGCEVIYDGQLWRLAALEGEAAVLERGGKSAVRVSLAAMFSSQGFRVIGYEASPRASLGPFIDLMRPDEYRELRRLEEHLHEVRTGYRSGQSADAREDEPRPEYHPARPLADRYAAKAVELGISVRSLRRRLHEYDADGLLGLVDQRAHREARHLGRVDERWIATARDVKDEFVDASQPHVTHLIERINHRVQYAYGDDCPLPSATTAWRALRELSRNENAFAGTSAKQKRSIAARPNTPLGGLHASRIGEYLLLDTSPLDIFALDRMTLKPLNTQLTLAMELGSRRVTGMRLSPISATAVDAAMVLYESIRPDSRSHTSSGILPYAGVPRNLVAGFESAEGLPGTAPETVIIDHGKIYLSRHVKAVCERLGISIQPARVRTPTDKAHVERLFGTIRSMLLAKMPGYKGPDVFSRGSKPEEFAYLYIDELEELIREWLVTVYDHTPHSGLREPEAPGIEISPREKWDLLIARSGSLQIPATPDLVYDFLPVVWRRIRNGGITIKNLEYDSAALNEYRNTSSPHRPAGGRWPFRYDPDDVRTVYFQRPDDHSWSAIPWKRAGEFDQPFAFDALDHARKLAQSPDRDVDAPEILHEMLDRWGAGLLYSPTDRRFAIRAAERQQALRESIAKPVAPPESETPTVDFDVDVEDDADFDADPALDDPDFYGTAMKVSE